MAEDEKWTQLQQILDSGDQKWLEEYAESMEAIDFVQKIGELEEEELKKLISMSDDEHLAQLLEEADDKMRLRLAELISDEDLLKVYEYMQKDDIVDLLGDFSIGRRKNLINLMKAPDRRIISQLLSYPEDSAGGRMTTAYIALRGNRTISESLHKIREIGPKTEVLETIYVIDANRRLIGFCDLRDILAEKNDVLISSIMDEHVISCQPETDQEEVARLVSRYDLPAIPVVSRTNQILGIVTVDDVIDVIIEEHDEDMLQMAGVNKEESLESTLGESIRMRLPWLLVNLATAFLASFTVKMFESTIEQVVALSAIMTIISGMGGNAGTQTMSILIRRLAQGELTAEQSRGPFFKELALGVIDGAATGAVTAGIVCLMYENVFLGVISFIAMVGNLLLSAFFGFLVPVILKKCHADPAVASSIFVTTATDVLGFFLFLGLANLFLPMILG